MRKKTDLRQAQQRVATRLYESDGLQTVVGMGGGKTAAAMTAIDELIADRHKRAALVIAPKRVAQLVWMREHKEWEHLKGLKITHVAGTPDERKRRLLTPGSQIYVVGIDNVQWLCEALAKLPQDHWLFDLLCIDELSRFKNPRGKRAKALVKLIRRFKTVWGLTGTPRPNGYEDQFRPLSLITRGQLWGFSFDKWRDERFMALDFHGHSWSIRPEWRERTIKEIGTVTVKIADKDMPDLPPLTPVFHWIDLPPKVMKLYKDMEKKLFAKIDGEQGILAANKAVATGKLAQIVQGFMYAEDGTTVQHIHTEKADLLVELIEGMDADNALLVYEFIEDLRVLKELYPGMPHLGRGTTDRQAEDYERQWNEGHLPQLAIHPASAGHGLNLQRGGRQFIWYGLTWSPELYDQTLKRIHRPGQSEHCFNHLILARNTIDEVKYNRVVLRMAEQDAFKAYLKEA